MTTIWNQNDIFRIFGQFWLNFHRLRFSLPEGARARQYTQNDRKEHLCRKVKKYFGFDEFLMEFRQENDIFANMGAYLIFKGILVENGNIWKWQKFLPYRRNFYFPISRIKFQTYFIIIIFWYMTPIMEIFYGGPPLTSCPMMCHLSKSLHIYIFTFSVCPFGA